MDYREPRQATRVVPKGVPHTLGEARAKLATVSDLMHEASVLTSSEAFDSIADEAYALFVILRELGRPESTGTGCKRHPQGAVDPIAPDGWGKCLLCNNRRRRGEGLSVRVRAPRGSGEAE